MRRISANSKLAALNGMLFVESPQIVKSDYVEVVEQHKQSDDNDQSAKQQSGHAGASVPASITPPRQPLFNSTHIHSLERSSAVFKVRRNIGEWRFGTGE